MPIRAERVQTGRQSAIVTPRPARLASQADGTLAERLAGVGEQLSRLAVAREVVDEVLAGATTAEVSPAPGQPEVAALPGAGRPPVTGLAVPPWRGGVEVSVLPRDYRDLVAVAEDAGRPLRAAQFAAAAGLSTDRGKVDVLRAKLKRLAERGWLAEDAGPGLFTLPAHNGNGLGEPVKPG